MRRLPQLEMRHFPLPRLINTKVVAERYGKRPGVSIYGFLSNRFASFYSRMIQASESDAPYVLDGLLHNEVLSKSMSMPPDTAGATETTFFM
ncbi:Tn3 family transposase, partial [Mesorhizobium sp.]|uniref:Tn3 family transposase n=1 Tax=Mesorhizobium sp. TaxID=1871066 RepID=UPI003450A9F5